MAPPTKTCATCGRTITWRKKWERDWESVRYCSDRCRSSARRDRDRTDELVDAVRARLARTPAGATACPSEVARAAYRGPAPEGWRELMEPVRRAARLLAADGELEFTQKGRRVDPSTAKGPVRLRPLPGLRPPG